MNIENNIINKIIAEITTEISETHITLTDEEMQVKINEKLSKYFEVIENTETRNNANIQSEQYLSEEEIDKLVHDEFLNIEEDIEETEKHFQELYDGFRENDLNNNLGDFDDKMSNFMDEINNDLKNLDNDNSNKTSSSEDLFQISYKEEEKKEKKKFKIKDFKELYKEELHLSIECFKNAVEIFKASKEISIVEIIGIIVVLSIPAILGGIIGILFILLLLALWQIGIIFKILLKYFNGIESTIKNTINSIKHKIATLKSGSGGFFKKLLFSNSLYSIVMFNGLLYLMIKGLIFPLKSVLDIDKTIANIIQRGIKGISNILRSPSQLILNATNKSSLKSGKKTLKNKGAANKKLQLSQKSKMQMAARRNNLLRQQMVKKNTPQTLSNQKTKISSAEMNRMKNLISGKINQQQLKASLKAAAAAEIAKQKNNTQSNAQSKPEITTKDLDRLKGQIASLISPSPKVDTNNNEKSFKDKFPRKNPLNAIKNLDNNTPRNIIQARNDDQIAREEARQAKYNEIHEAREEQKNLEQKATKECNMKEGAMEEYHNKYEKLKESGMSSEEANKAVALDMQKDGVENLPRAMSLLGQYNSQVDYINDAKQDLDKNFSTKAEAYRDTINDLKEAKELDRKQCIERCNIDPEKAMNEALEKNNLDPNSRDDRKKAREYVVQNAIKNNNLDSDKVHLLTQNLAEYDNKTQKLSKKEKELSVINQNEKKQQVSRDSGGRQF